MINDGSTNSNTETILNEIAKKDNRIKILNQKNAGPAAARYFGVENADSDIVFQLDADDVIDKTLLECGYWTLYTNPEVVWAYSDSCAFGNMEYLWKVPFDTIKQKKKI